MTASERAWELATHVTLYGQTAAQVQAQIMEIACQAAAEMRAECISRIRRKADTVQTGPGGVVADVCAQILRDAANEIETGAKEDASE